MNMKTMTTYLKEEIKDEIERIENIFDIDDQLI